MTQDRMYIRLAAAAALALGTYATTLVATPREFNVAQTNLVERWITNQIEVLVPANRFVNEYHTNLVQVFRTNHVALYRTNLVLLDRTNIVLAYRTNVFTWRLTNTVPVEAYQTNFVTAYRTNIKALTLTNFETVLVLRTNWVRNPVTNLVDVEMQAKPVTAPPGHAEPRAEPRARPTAGVAQSSLTYEPLQMEAVRVRGGSNNRVQVKLSVRPTLASSGSVQVQQWRVESEDGRILSFGSEQEFNRELPVGRYKVEVKTGHATANTITTRRTLTVTVTSAVIEPKPLAKN